MMTSRIKVSTTNLDLNKQTIFALASALTATAKQGQSAVLNSIEGTFTIRNNWDKVGPYAVKVRPATKTNLVAYVGTAADFMAKFIEEPAGATVIKLPQGEFLAIPTGNVRRTKRDIIRAAQRPRKLAGKRDFLVPLKHGRGFVLMQKQGRGKAAKAVAMYILVPRARIKERDFLFGPTRQAFEKNFSNNFYTALKNALATART
jgi:hypothetical protein